MWHVSHHIIATGQVREVAGYRLCRGDKGKSRAAEKILGKAENGLTELGSIKKKKEVVGKEVKFKDTSSFRIKGTTAIGSERIYT